MMGGDGIWTGLRASGITCPVAMDVWSAHVAVAEVLEDLDA